MTDPLIATGYDTPDPAAVEAARALEAALAERNAALKSSRLKTDGHVEIKEFADYHGRRLVKHQWRHGKKPAQLLHYVGTSQIKYQDPDTGEIKQHVVSFPMNGFKGNVEDAFASFDLFEETYREAFQANIEKQSADNLKKREAFAKMQAEMQAKLADTAKPTDGPKILGVDGRSLSDRSDGKPLVQAALHDPTLGERHVAKDGPARKPGLAGA